MVLAAASGCSDRTGEIGYQDGASYKTEQQKFKKFKIPAQKQSPSNKVSSARSLSSKPQSGKNHNVEQDLARAKEYCRRGMEMAAVRHLDRVLEKARDDDFILKTKSHYLLAEIYRSKNLENQADHHWEQFLDNYRRLRSEPRLKAHQAKLKGMADFLGPAAGIEQNKPAETEEPGKR